MPNQINDPWWASWRSFELSLRHNGASPLTIKVYKQAALQFHDWLVANDRSVDPHDVSKDDLRGWTADLLDQKSRATARSRFAAMRRFFNWLVEENDLEHSPADRLRAPKPREVPPPVLSDDELRRLLKAVEGKSFEARRDTALLRVLIDTGLRRSEVAGLQVDDVDLTAGILTIRRRKGGNKAHVGIGDRTAYAIDRYLRLRAKHPHRDSPMLWIGSQGPLRGDGLYQAVQRWGRRARLDRPVFTHLLRHSWAHAMKSAGASTEDLEVLGGWSQSSGMVARYGRSAASERAIATHRRLGPGDRL